MNFRIYGLGAIGSNLLVQLAKTLPEAEYVGTDDDKVEARNIGTQAYYLEHVGQRKANAMRIVLGRYVCRPKYTADLFYVRNKVADAQEGSLVVDAFDNTASRRHIAAAKGNILHIGFSPQYTAECIWNEAYTVPNDIAKNEIDICSMTDAVPFIHFVVNAAALTIMEWVQSGAKRSFIITGKSSLKWLD